MKFYILFNYYDVFILFNSYIFLVIILFQVLEFIKKRGNNCLNKQIKILISLVFFFETFSFLILNLKEKEFQLFLYISILTIKNFKLIIILKT